MKQSDSKNILGISIVVAVVLIVIILVVTRLVKTGGLSSDTKKESASVSSLLKRVNYSEKTPVKGSVDFSNSSLYDELPNIEKYPLTLEDTSGDVNIEIFSSPEKAGTDADSWLIDMAKAYNSEKHTVDGKTVSVSVRSISSGLAADYIISNKYVPTGFSPSNALWGSYSEIQGAKLSEVTDRMVGNTAGFLVSKNGADYSNYKDVISAVIDGKINVGYTNPLVSSTGMNLLITILSDYGNGDVGSDAATEAFASFQRNIPFVATNTIQMRDSSAKGSLDGMTMEYQSYSQDKDLMDSYDFIPFGIRHDNPMYYCESSKGGDIKKEALKNFTDYCKSDSAQKAATEKGFNQNSDYKSDLNITGKDVKTSLEIYKKEKDSGQAIVAVFVADVSGSMNGEPLAQLKESLSNGMQYINENNYVGLVSYSSDVAIEVPIAEFDLNQKAYFQGAIGNMIAGGNTASYNALVVAMDMIEKAKKDHPDAKTMIFLLSDGQANEGYSLDKISPTLKSLKIPIYTICYGTEADVDAMKKISSVNEAANIQADSSDIVYQIKSLFNSNL